MLSKLRIRIKLLPLPRNLDNCLENYTLPKESANPLYGVCISRDKYYVYDLLLLDKKAIDEVKKLEDKLYDILVTGESIIESLDKISDYRLRHVVERTLIGYGVVEAFLWDPDVVNMHIMIGKPIQIIHRVYGVLESNVVLEEDDVRELAMRLAAAAGKPLSESMPLANFVEPRFEARVTIIYLSDITMKKNIVIDVRKPTEKPWTILKLIHLGSLSFEEAAFLWLMIKYRVPIIIVGEIMTGKTTLASALLALVPPKSRVMTIEDVPEFRLPIDYWTRTTLREFGEYRVSVFDLVKIAVRLSLDYIIIGEIRGEEAREWANAILLGHGAVTTFHAESPEAALLRLLSPPISVDPQVIRFLNVFVKTNAFYRGEERIYRHELYIHDEGRITPLFVYDNTSDKIILSPEFKDPIKELGFIERIVKGYRVSRDDLNKEYNAMVQTLKEVYNNYVKIDPKLENPSYLDLPHILYAKLREKLGNKNGG